MPSARLVTFTSIGPASIRDGFQVYENRVNQMG